MSKDRPTPPQWIVDLNGDDESKTIPDSVIEAAEEQQYGGNEEFEQMSSNKKKKWEQKIQDNMRLTGPSDTLQKRVCVREDCIHINEAGMSYFDHDLPFEYEEDGYKIVRGSAWSGPGCHLGCGVLMYIKDNKVVRVEGDPDNPYNQGRLCPRCLAIEEIINDKRRVLYPMKRDFMDRGKDKWERISWDEALDTIETRFNYYKENYGGNSVLFMQGTGRDIAAYISRLSWSFGSANYCFSLSNVSCFGPRILAATMTTGQFMVGDYSQQFIDRYDNPEWQCPGVTVVWGNNPIIANSDGAYGHWVTDVLERGSKLLVCDPQLTWLASRADVWCQVRPGADGALALAMANVMFEEELYDKEYCDYWVYGTDEFKESVQEWTPEKAEEVCWVPADTIRKAARLIAQNPPALLQWGVALDQRNDCFLSSRAVLALFCITGNLERPGSNIVGPELLKYITGWGREFCPEDMEEKRIGADELMLYKVGLQVCSINKAIDVMIEQPEDNPIKASWLQTVNPIACAGVDNERTIEAFMNLEFNVYVDLFFTPTAQAFCDMILPACTYPERNGIRVGDGTQRGETINKAVDPPGECRSDMEINLELGRRWNPEAWPWATVEEMYSYILAETGLDFEGVRAVAPGYLPFEYNKHEKGLMRPDGSIGFPTQSGRVELYAGMLAMAGAPALPFYDEPTTSPVANPELAVDFPLICSSGMRGHSTFHSENRQSKRLRNIKQEPIAVLHSETAKQYGVENGHWFWIEGPVFWSEGPADQQTSRIARARRVAVVQDTVAPGIIVCDHGWWHPEGDPENLYDVMDLNINNLVSWDSGSTGIGCNYRCIMCRIYPVAEGEVHGA